MKQGKKHILVVTNLYPNPMEPGRAVFLPQLVEQLKSVFRISVMSPLPWFPNMGILRRFQIWYKFSQVPARAIMDGQEVIYPKYVVIPKTLGFLQSVFLFCSLFEKIRRLHKAKPIDLINAHWVFPDGVASVWVGRLLKIPVVVTAHGCDINRYIHFRFRRPQIISALQHAQWVTSISDAQKRILQDVGIPGRKIRTILNGVNIDKFSIKDRVECQRHVHLPQNKKIILYVGRIEEKNIPQFIQAIHRIHKQFTHNLIVTIIGEGAERRLCEEKVKEWGLEDIVTFYGEVKHENIVFFMGASDVLCLPSKREGCPNVVLEALSCGLPVVSSKVGAVPDIVTEYSGILFEPENSDDLATSLVVALQRDWDKQKIRSSVKNFTWEQTVQSFTEVFFSVIDKEK